MYLAGKRQPDGRLRFVIRHSYQDESGNWLYRELFDLGFDPGDYVVAVTEKAYYIDPVVEDAISSQGLEVDYDDLERLFWPFLDPEVRRVAERFGCRSREKRYGKKHGSEELHELLRDILGFDRRRLCFLKFCQIDLEELAARPLPFFRQLLNRSRDEIEHLIEFMEFGLRPWEMKGYLYAVFDLPRRFYPRLSRFIPDVQDQDLMDQYFLEELCNMNRDTAFLDSGAVPWSEGRGLHPYLRRYLFQYFDISFRDAGAGRRPGFSGGGPGGAWQPPPSSSEKRYFDIMGINQDEFKAMTESEIISIFRKKAQQLHPDKGGRHDDFILLQEAYHRLIRKKRW
ncbi:MAG TPA: hypothetical protein EYP57_00990 [Thermodesulfobacteriaceae bacterium]|nr:hypothetical protein [Thermodesulfobacteriaceae bacterium]